MVHKKKVKVRLVYDSAGTQQGTSLYNALRQGPYLNIALRGVLIRFREHPVAFVADIKGMLKSGFVRPYRGDLMRFFWYEDNESAKKLVANGAKKTIREHLQS